MQLINMKTTSFVMFCNLNKCQLYYKNYIMELVEDIFFQTSWWGRSLMPVIDGQPLTRMFMNYVKLVICANEQVTY